ncbi:MAG: hypothetical protein IJ941_03030, partial [Clostridia bacterium]|nr:hypothetical protein [Clostridia bacterium]
FIPLPDAAHLAFFMYVSAVLPCSLRADMPSLNKNIPNTISVTLFMAHPHTPVIPAKIKVNTVFKVRDGIMPAIDNSAFNALPPSSGNTGRIFIKAIYIFASANSAALCMNLHPIKQIRLHTGPHRAIISSSHGLNMSYISIRQP